MPLKSSHTLVAATVVVGVFCGASPAWAGFQWSSPAPTYIGVSENVRKPGDDRLAGAVVESISEASEQATRAPEIVTPSPVVQPTAHNDGAPVSVLPKLPVVESKSRAGGERVLLTIPTDAPSFENKSFDGEGSDGSSHVAGGAPEILLTSPTAVDSVDAGEAKADVRADHENMGGEGADIPAAAMAPALDAPPALPSRAMSMGTLPAEEAKEQKNQAGDVFQGFADRVPLTVALRQILPSSHTYSVDHDVDMGVMVSFKGGKSWQQTLADALQGVGLGMRQQAQMVTVSRLDSNASSKRVEPLTSFVAPSAPVNVLGVLPATGRVVPGKVVDVPRVMSVPKGYAGAPPSASPDIRLGAGVKLGGANTSGSRAAVVSSNRDIVVPEIWAAERGESLRKTLDTWSRRARVEVEWLAEYDYPLQASVDFYGSYEAAVRALLTGFEGAHPQPVAQLHTNPGMGQRVLVVRTRGSSSKD